MANNSENIEYDVYNVYENVLFEYDTEKNIMHVKWDITNGELSRMMIQEQSPYSENFYNIGWVDNFKTFVDWKKGEPLYPYIITNSKIGQFSVKIHSHPQCDDFACIKIDEDGYVFTRPFINGEFKYKLVRTNCVYNDIMESMEEPYILK